MVPAASNSAHADRPADHMSGHRGRMRAKLLDKGSEALSELELLEMLLYAGNRCSDTKPLAKALMWRFSSLSAALRVPATLLAQQSGTVDQTPVYVREVINAVLRHHARAVILVHNHPSGETEPSRADFDMTAELKTALSLVTITLHDHLIVAGKTVVSFKSLGLL